MKRLLPILIFLLLMPDVNAWWNSSYRFRYEITNTSTLDPDIPFSVNDNTTINGTPTWTVYNNTGSSNYTYSTASGPSGSIAIAGTDFENCWENATSLDGNCPTSVYPSNIIGWYHFDDGIDANDSSQLNHDLTAYDNVASSTGKIGEGISCDGANDYVENTTTVNTTGMKDAGTITAWIYLDRVNANEYFIDMSSSSDNRFLLYKDTLNDIWCGWRRASGQTNWDSFGSVTSGQWYFIAMTWNTSVKRCWLDSTLGIDEASPANLPLNSNPDNIRMCADYNIANDFQGDIDEVMIANYSMSPENVEQIYKNSMGTLMSLGSEEILNTAPNAEMITTNNTNFSSPPQTLQARAWDLDADTLNGSIICNSTIVINSSMVNYTTTNFVFNLVVGSYNCYFNVSDGTDSNTTNNITITVSEANITINIIYPQNTTYTSIVDIPLRISTTDNSSNIDTYSYSLDGSSYIIFTPNTTLFNIENGAHNITVRVNLSTGYENQTTISFEVDYMGELNATEFAIEVWSYTNRTTQNYFDKVLGGDFLANEQIFLFVLVAICIYLGMHTKGRAGVPFFLFTGLLFLVWGLYIRDQLPFLVFGSDVGLTDIGLFNEVAMWTMFGLSTIMFVYPLWGEVQRRRNL